MAWIVFVLAMLAPIISGQPEVVYLRGVERLNSSGYYDYYFSCSVKSSYLQWDYGSQRLTGFLEQEAGLVVVETRSSFEYTATLLSSQFDPGSNQQRLDSVLVISFSGSHPSTFEVTCSSNSEFNTTMVYGLHGNISENSSNDHSVLINHIVSHGIVRNKKNTHIFACGASSEQQFYEIHNSNIVFTEYDQIGEDKTDLSRDGSIVDTQGVLIANQPYTRTSLLFITDNEDVTVVCYFGNAQAQLNSTPIAAEEPSSMPEISIHEDSVTTKALSSSEFPTTTTTLSSTVFATDDPGAGVSSNQKILPGVMTAAVGLVAFVIVIVVIFLILFMKNQKRQEKADIFNDFQKEELHMGNNDNTRNHSFGKVIPPEISTSLKRPFPPQTKELPVESIKESGDSSSNGPVPTNKQTLEMPVPKEPSERAVPEESDSVDINVDLESSVPSNMVEDTIPEEESSKENISGESTSNEVVSSTLESEKGSEETESGVESSCKGVESSVPFIMAKETTPEEDGSEGYICGGSSSDETASPILKSENACEETDSGDESCRKCLDRDDHHHQSLRNCCISLTAPYEPDTISCEEMIEKPLEGQYAGQVVSSIAVYGQTQDYWKTTGSDACSVYIPYCGLAKSYSVKEASSTESLLEDTPEVALAVIGGSTFKMDYVHSLHDQVYHVEEATVQSNKSAQTEDNSQCASLTQCEDPCDSSLNEQTEDTKSVIESTFFSYFDREISVWPATLYSETISYFTRMLSRVLSGWLTGPKEKASPVTLRDSPRGIFAFNKFQVGYILLSMPIALTKKELKLLGSMAELVRAVQLIFGTIQHMLYKFFYVQGLMYYHSVCYTLASVIHLVQLTGELVSPVSSTSTWLGTGNVLTAESTQLLQMNVMYVF